MEDTTDFDQYDHNNDQSDTTDHLSVRLSETINELQRYDDQIQFLWTTVISPAQFSTPVLANVTELEFIKLMHSTPTYKILIDEHFNLHNQLSQSNQSNRGKRYSN